MRQQGQSDPLAVAQLGSCASSGHTWRPWVTRHSREEAGLPGAQPLPRVLELAASKATHFTAFDHSGTGAKQPVETMDGEHAVMD